MSLILHYNCEGQITLGGLGYKCIKCQQKFHRPLKDEGTKYGDRVRYMRPMNDREFDRLCGIR